MSEVEQSIQLQIQDIAAVKKAFLASLAARQPSTLWWLVDNSENIAYENRVKGDSILAIDNSIDNVDIGSFFANWFGLQNSYFAQDQPFPGVQTLQDAVSQVYRWRVPQYFNDIAVSGAGQAFSPLYVFPHEDTNLGTYAVTGTVFTKGVGSVDPTVCGPGILGVASYSAAITATISLTLTAVYSDGTSGSIPVTVPVPSVSDPFASTPVGGTALAAAYDASAPALGPGIVGVASVAGFKVGTTVPNLVVITENTTPVTPPNALPSWTTEVAELVAINSSTNQLTLRQLTPTTSLGGTAPTPFPNGIRNSYSTAAMVYPLFNDVTGVVGTTGTAGDQVLISFYPDWAQGFVDVSTIVIPQTKEGQSRGVVEEKDDLGKPQKSDQVLPKSDQASPKSEKSESAPTQSSGAPPKAPAAPSKAPGHGG
jgi:hypothetical protein